MPNLMRNRLRHDICQLSGCRLIAKYNLYRTYPDGNKVWLKVCSNHEKMIAAENLERVGGYKVKR